MSYLALARKWRPRTFSQFVGQEHVSKALINSLSNQKIHHAYLFTGTRGVGKTTVARLLAKCLNCEQGITANPCMSCETCIAVEEGRFFDLIEIDGASKTRVEDTREILDNVQYAPSAGRYKIYLIDEVHMLSQHSFNALLKTLEEPPAHVIFILATTESKKLPVTILSRCLQFHLRHIHTDIIIEQLRKILTSENIAFEDEALALLASAAAGSMRDALSLLDQAIASTDTVVRKQEIQHLLGHSQQDYALQLLQALASGSAVNIIKLCKQIAVEGGHFRYVLEEILEYLHQLTIKQHLPAESNFLSFSKDINDLAKLLKAEDIQLFYQIGLKGLEDMQHAPTQSMGFEMTLLRMLTFMPVTTKATMPLVHETEISTQPLEATKPTSSKPAALPLPQEVAETRSTENWSAILDKLNLKGLAQTAAENSMFLGKDGKNVRLQSAKGHQSLFTKAIVQRLEQALESYYSEPIKIELRFEDSNSTPAQLKQQVQAQNQQTAKSSLENDAFLQKIKEEFSAEIVKNSIEPLEN